MATVLNVTLWIREDTNLKTAPNCSIGNKDAPMRMRNGRITQQQTQSRISGPNYKFSAQNQQIC